MADDKVQKGKDESDESEEKKRGPGEGELGNLPPLSDFDSGGFQSDAGLPPLGAAREDSGKKSVGGLPPIADLPVETPRPTGGNVKVPPPGFRMSDSDFESPALDTPAAKPRKGRPGFQDPAADSDFSPETPEIGPGPDSDLDTPMFDSAFGGAGGAAGAGTFTPAFDTPAPTQAMETPMFGGEKPRAGAAGPPAFDEGAFTPSAGFGAGGTPIPDFSPDTAAGARPSITPQPEVRVAARRPAADARGILITLVAAVVFLIIGIGLGPYLSTKATFIPNPLNTTVADQKQQIDDLNSTVRRLQAQPTTGEGPAVSPEKVAELLRQQEDLTASIQVLAGKEQEAKGKLDKTTSELAQVRSDLDSKNEDFVKTQDAFEDLQNRTAIVQARQLGLVAEVDRLTGLVGKLEEAVDRSQTTKEALQTSVERLLIQIKEGIPLTPDKYARPARIAAVEDLKAKVDEAKWVTPALLDAYTSLYQKELEIAASTAYFYAKIPVTNRLSVKETKWAECVMKGNWAVYYRTLDGKNIGSYENVAEPEAIPSYAFRETLPDDIQKQIEKEIMAYRPDGYEVKLKALAEKQAITDGTTTPFQKAFGSL